MRATTPLRDLTLDDRYTAVSGPVMLGGMQALVRLMLDLRRLDARRGHDTGVFISGYQGSPLGGLDHRASARVRATLSRRGSSSSPGLNEELAATAVGGTQLLGELPGATKQGVTGFWYGKTPGPRSRRRRDPPQQPVRHRPAGRCRRADRGRPDGQVLDGAERLRADVPQPV